MADTIFYNADYIVIEYIDLIKSPYLILLNLIRKNERLKEILNIESIEYLDDAGLYEWYVNRKHQNFFIDLCKYPDKISDKQLDELLDDQINITERFYSDAIFLPLTDMLKNIKNKRIAGDIIIYHPHKNDFAKKDLESFLNHKYTFMNNFDEVMDKAKENSTYFLSDINKILLMKEKGILRCSSITLPIEYRYNKKNMNDMKLDIDSLFKENPFKLSFFQSCTRPIDE